MALSQTKLILQHLLEHGSITSYDAFNLYGATRLSAIIFNLRHNDWYDIETTFAKVTTRFDKKTKIAVYKLHNKEGCEQQWVKHIMLVIGLKTRALLKKSVTY